MHCAVHVSLLFGLMVKVRELVERLMALSQEEADELCAVCTEVMTPEGNTDA